MRVRASGVRSNALRVAVAGCALVIGAVACRGTALLEETEAVASFVGDYGATAGRTAVQLEVAEDSFTAVTFTEPGNGMATARAESVSPARAPGSATATWVVFTGDVTASGTTVTVRVTGVERDGQALQGAELAPYTICATTVTADDRFAAEVMAGILECLGAPDAAVAAYEYEEHERPADLVVGTWDFAPRLSDSSRGSGSLVISPTELEVVAVESCRADPFHDPGPLDPPESEEPTLSVDLIAGDFEGAPLVFTVILSPTASGTVTVDWATSDLTDAEWANAAGGAATAGADYAAGNGTLTFHAGQSSRAFTVATIEDDAVEGNEAFKVELSNPGGAAIWSAPEQGGLRGGLGIGLIVDDDAPPCFSIELSFDASIEDTSIAVSFREGRMMSGDAPPIVLDRDNYGDFFLDYTGGPADLDYEILYVIGSTGDRAAFRVQHSDATWGSRR